MPDLYFVDLCLSESSLVEDLDVDPSRCDFVVDWFLIDEEEAESGCG